MFIKGDRIVAVEKHIADMWLITPGCEFTVIKHLNERVIHIYADVDKNNPRPSWLGNDVVTQSKFFVLKSKDNTNDT